MTASVDTHGGRARDIHDRIEEFAEAYLSPAPLVPEEAGLTRAVRTTFAGSWARLLWSVERLAVGLCLALPWAAIALLSWLAWRRLRRRAATPAA